MVSFDNSYSDRVFGSASVAREKELRNKRLNIEGRILLDATGHKTKLRRALDDATREKLRYSMQKIWGSVDEPWLQSMCDRLSNEFCREVEKRARRHARRKANKQAASKNNNKIKKETPKKKKEETRHKRKKWYHDYMQSDLWLGAIRPRILVRDAYKCRVCGVSDNLQVHHRSYDDDVMAGENDDQLITLCGRHHQEIEFRFYCKKGKKNQRRSPEEKEKKLLELLAYKFT